jgi:hypothetical protein
MLLTKETSFLHACRAIRNLVIIYSKCGTGRPEDKILKTSVPDPDPNPHFLCLPDPDPLARCMDPHLDPPPDPGPSTIKQKGKKNLNSYCFVTSLGLFIFENDVNVPSKSNKQKNFS